MVVSNTTSLTILLKLQFVCINERQQFHHSLSHSFNSLRLNYSSVFIYNLCYYFADSLFFVMARDNFHLEKSCLSRGIKSHTEK